MKKILDILDQKKVWIDRSGVEHRLKDMDKQHRANVLALLERMALKLYHSACYEAVTCPEPSGDMANDSYDAAINELFNQSHIDWLNEKPLVVKLRKMAARDEKVADERQGNGVDFVIVDEVWRRELVCAIDASALGINTPCDKCGHNTSLHRGVHNPNLTGCLACMMISAQKTS